MNLLSSTTFLAPPFFYPFSLIHLPRGNNTAPLPPDFLQWRVQLGKKDKSRPLHLPIRPNRPRKTARNGNQFSSFAREPEKRREKERKSLSIYLSLPPFVLFDPFQFVWLKLPVLNSLVFFFFFFTNGSLSHIIATINRQIKKLEDENARRFEALPFHHHTRDDRNARLGYLAIPPARNGRGAR